MQGELQKSRDTGTNLGDLGSTLTEVQDTLGGGGPSTHNGPSGHSYNNLQSHVPPFAPSKDSSSIAALQSQLNATQSALAGHVGKIRDLEGMLKEHDVMKREVGDLRKEVESAKKDMELVLNSRGNGRNVVVDGRESPIAAMLEEQEAHDQEEEEDDDDDRRSIHSVETIRSGPRSAQRLRNARTNGSSQFDDHVSPPPPPPPSSALADRQRLLEEQNERLSSRLAQISTELEEATTLGQSLLSQHAEAISTIRTLEERVVGLEKAVEGQEAEAEERWMGWKNTFEESWKKERGDWIDEREKLVEVVRKWEVERREREERERVRLEEEGEEDEEESVEGEEGVGAVGIAAGSTKRGKAKSRNRRRRSSTAKASLGATSPSMGSIPPASSLDKGIVIPSLLTTGEFSGGKGESSASGAEVGKEDRTPVNVRLFSPSFLNSAAGY